MLFIKLRPAWLIFDKVIVNGLALKVVIDLKIFVGLERRLKTRLSGFYLLVFLFFLSIFGLTFEERKISQPRRGGRLIYRDKFPLKQMLSFLRQAADQIFGTVKDVYIPINDILPLPSPPT